MCKCFIVFMLLIMPAPAFAADPFAAWQDTLSWLERNYYYPEIQSPNFDWPSTYYPRRLPDNTVLALDGARLPVMPGAYHLRMTGEEFTDYFPVTGVSFYLKYENSKEALKIFNAVAAFFDKNFKKDLVHLGWENGAVYREVRIAWDNTGNALAGISGKRELHSLEVVVPGRAEGYALSIPDQRGHIEVAYSVKNVRHYFFFRTNLLPANDQVALSDGTIIPLMPGKKICKVETGNSQLNGETTGASVSYEYRVWNNDEKTFVTGYYDAEYVKLYSFYAKHFRIAADRWQAYQEDNAGFVLSYANAGMEIQIRVDGIAKDNGKHTDIKPMYDWYRKNNPDLLPYNESGFAVFIQYFGKHQVIPGSEEAPLPKYAKYVNEDYDTDTIMLVEENDWEYENSLEAVAGADADESGGEEGLLDIWESAGEDYGDE